MSDRLEKDGRDRLSDQVVHALGGSGREVLEFLPVLLQDLEELGSNPRAMEELIRTYGDGTHRRWLDLCCGKGAVSLHLAARLGVLVHGVDGMESFVAHARRQARLQGLEELCTFETGDAACALKTARKDRVDGVIWGGAGDVLGPPAVTLEALARSVRRGGLILVDEAYNLDPQAPGWSRDRWLDAMHRTGLTLLGELGESQEELRRINRENNRKIARRAAELAERFPDRARLFWDYLAAQKAESRQVEDDMVCVTWLLQRPGYTEVETGEYDAVD